MAITVFAPCENDTCIFSWKQTQPDEQEKLIKEKFTEEEVKELLKEGFTMEQIAYVAKDKIKGDKQCRIIGIIFDILTWFIPVFK